MRGGESGKRTRTQPTGGGSRYGREGAGRTRGAVGAYNKNNYCYICAVGVYLLYFLLCIIVMLIYGIKRMRRSRQDKRCRCLFIYPIVDNCCHL